MPAGRQERKGSAGRMAHGRALVCVCARQSCSVVASPGTGGPIACPKAAEKARGWLQLLHFTTALGWQTEVSEHSENI